MRFIGPFAFHHGLAGDWSFSIWKHPARLIVGAAADPTDSEPKIELFALGVRPQMTYEVSQAARHLQGGFQYFTCPVRALIRHKYGDQA